MSGDAATGLRAWAEGSYAGEAGVELLIRAFDGRFAEPGCPWICRSPRSDWFWIDIEALVEHSVWMSDGERRVLAVVAALADARPIADLTDVLSGVDRRHLSLLLAAMAHAGGSHEQVDVIRDGERVVFDRLSSLLPWPSPGPVGSVAG